MEVCLRIEIEMTHELVVELAVRLLMEMSTVYVKTLWLPLAVAKGEAEVL